MSTRVMAQVWPLQMAPTVKAVLVSLADQANDDGACWPSVGTVAERTCLTDRAVQKALAWLEAEGYVIREMKAGRATRYTLTPERRSPPNVVHPRTTFTTTPEPRSPAPEPRSPRTVKNRKGNRKEEKAGAFALPDWIPADWWQQWEEHRRGIRKPLTDLARSLQIERLQELAADGHGPVDCIKAAIANRWQGFYPPPARAGNARASPAERRDAETAEFLGRLTGGLAGTKPERSIVDVIEPADVRRIA